MFFIPVFKLQSRSQSFRIFNLNLNLPLCLNVQTVPRLICVKSSCTDWPGYCYSEFLWVGARGDLFGHEAISLKVNLVIDYGYSLA